MKIISKFKDFYDYKMTKYGVDEKLVYTRKTYYEYSQRFSININTEFTERISEENFNKYFKEYTEYFTDNNYHKVLFIGKKSIHLFFTENGIHTHLDIKNPEDFVWQSLVEFLSNKRSEKEIIPEVSDKNKILSKGFDLKSSFRPNMKKTK